jgi:hypothetical protein
VSVLKWAYLPIPVSVLKWAYFRPISSPFAI